MPNYYEEINHLVKRLEVNKKARYLQDNSETLNTFWNIGKLLVEAQGGEERAKYGNELIKKWSKKLTELYGKGYTITNLKYFRKYYLIFPKGHALRDELTWTNIKIILPIKNDNKRNYYINQCLERRLSSRELINEIKNNAYERLLEKPEKIELLPINQRDSYQIKEHIKNPILIQLNKEDKLLKEKDLQLKILSQLKNFFSELGQGFTYVGNEYKFVYNNKKYYLDLLLFNIEMNCYVVVELKFRELRVIDKAQINFYMKLVDDNLKRDFHNKTIGIIVSKKQDDFIVSFVSDEEVIPITYQVVQ